MLHKTLILPLMILVLLILSALFAPLFAPHPPMEIHLEQGLSPPSFTHPLGQDKLGRDILSRILYGGRVSLGISGAVLILSLVLGVTVGATAGLAGGKVEACLMRVADIFLAFPGILLAITLSAILGHSVWNMILALSAAGWVGFARITRGQILVIREAEYIQAARALGLTPTRIILRHLFPNSAAPIIVEAVFYMASTMVAEASLSFLGLGVQPPYPSWGGMLNDARSFLLVAPRLTIVPGFVIMTAVLALNLFGDRLRDRLDARR